MQLYDAETLMVAVQMGAWVSYFIFTFTASIELEKTREYLKEKKLLNNYAFWKDKNFFLGIFKKRRK